MENIKTVKLSQLKPRKKQDRKDWSSPTAREYIEKLKRSIGLEMPDGSLYGIRETIVVTPGPGEDEYTILRGESRWRAGSEVEQEKNVEITCEIKIVTYEDKVIEHMDHATENSHKRPLNIYERAMSIKQDKDNGLTTEQIIALHGLSNKTVVSKYMGVFRLNKLQQKIVKDSFINDLNLINKLAKISDDDIKELRHRCEEGEQAKKVIGDILNRNKPRPEREPSYRISFSKSQYSAILELLDLNPEDIDNPDEDIEEILKSKLEEISGKYSTEEPMDE
ncbi:TPA: ParB/RepB/Spo0J family partition protein [Escherichia coli]